MDCKGFTARHPAYIDDTLPGVEMSAMRDHLTACKRCSGRDSDIRRALLLVKNLPQVSVSENFQGRLRARLATEAPLVTAPDSRVSDFGLMKWAVAAGLLIIVAGGVKSLAPNDGASPTRLAAVVATGPIATAVSESAPEYVASMSTGIPMWPALMLAEEGPLRFAAAGAQNASWDRPQ